MARLEAPVRLERNLRYVFHSNFAVYIESRRNKPCEFLGFVWTDCRGNKSYYVITSPANIEDVINESSILFLCLIGQNLVVCHQSLIKLSKTRPEPS